MNVQLENLLEHLGTHCSRFHALVHPASLWEKWPRYSEFGAGSNIFLFVGQPTAPVVSEMTSCYLWNKYLLNFLKKKYTYTWIMVFVKWFK